jgi:hypothetical protein
MTYVDVQVLPRDFMRKVAKDFPESFARLRRAGGFLALRRHMIKKTKELKIKISLDRRSRYLLASISSIENTRDSVQSARASSDSIVSRTSAASSICWTDSGTSSTPTEWTPRELDDVPEDAPAETRSQEGDAPAAALDHSNRTAVLSRQSNGTATGAESVRQLHEELPQNSAPSSRVVAHGNGTAESRQLREELRRIGAQVTTQERALQQVARESAEANRATHEQLTQLQASIDALVSAAALTTPTSRGDDQLPR